MQISISLPLATEKKLARRQALRSAVLERTEEVQCGEGLGGHEHDVMLTSIREAQTMNGRGSTHSRWMATAQKLLHDGEPGARLHMDGGVGGV